MSPTARRFASSVPPPARRFVFSALPPARHFASFARLFPSRVSTTDGPFRPPRPLFFSSRRRTLLPVSLRLVRLLSSRWEPLSLRAIQRARAHRDGAALYRDAHPARRRPHGAGALERRH